jgi:RNA-directed DNA polymerase
MKRIGNLYQKIYSLENLILAEKNARKGKSKQKGVKSFDLNKEDNLINLHHVLLNKEYKTSPYKIFKVFDGKEREIFQLPYYPDRITHHGIMNVLEKIFVKTFVSDTYSCIKKRGIHHCLRKLNSSLKDVKNTTFCLKMDIKKFYPSIDNALLKKLLRKKFKDVELLYLLDEIIDSNEQGQPIGNYLSQYFANFYLTYFDHYIKEILKIKSFFRYCDDIVILGNNKEELRNDLIRIIDYLQDNLKLRLSNYQIFPVKSRGIDFVGYKCYHYGEVYLRDSIKKRYIKMMKYNRNPKSEASYKGWLQHANCINLRNKYERL